MNISSQDLKKMERIAQMMHGKDEDEVVDELAYLINSGQIGLTPERTLEMIRAIQPMLNSSQRRTLSRLATELKKGY